MVLNVESEILGKGAGERPRSPRWGVPLLGPPLQVARQPVVAPSVDAASLGTVEPASLPASGVVVEPASLGGGVVLPASGGWQTLNEMMVDRLNPSIEAPPPRAAAGGVAQMSPGSALQSESPEHSVYWEVLQLDAQVAAKPMPERAAAAASKLMSPAA